MNSLIINRQQVEVDCVAGGNPASNPFHARKYLGIAGLCAILTSGVPGFQPIVEAQEVIQNLIRIDATIVTFDPDILKKMPGSVVSPNGVVFEACSEVVLPHNSGEGWVEIAEPDADDVDSPPICRLKGEFLTLIEYGNSTGEYFDVSDGSIGTPCPEDVPVDFSDRDNWSIKITGPVLPLLGPVNKDGVPDLPVGCYIAPASAAANTTEKLSSSESRGSLKAMARDELPPAFKGFTIHQQRMVLSDGENALIPNIHYVNYDAEQLSLTNDIDLAGEKHFAPVVAKSMCSKVPGDPVNTNPCVYQGLPGTGQVPMGCYLDRECIFYVGIIGKPAWIFPERWISMKLANGKISDFRVSGQAFTGIDTTPPGLVNIRRVYPVNSPYVGPILAARIGWSFEFSEPVTNLNSAGPVLRPDGTDSGLPSQLYPDFFWDFPIDCDLSALPEFGPFPADPDVQFFGHNLDESSWTVGFNSIELAIRPGDCVGNWFMRLYPRNLTDIQDMAGNSLVIDPDYWPLAGEDFQPDPYPGSIYPLRLDDHYDLLPTGVRLEGINRIKPSRRFVNTAGSVAWQVTFSQPVQGVSADDFVVDTRFLSGVGEIFSMEVTSVTELIPGTGNLQQFIRSTVFEVTAAVVGSTPLSGRYEVNLKLLGTGIWAKTAADGSPVSEGDATYAVESPAAPSPNQTFLLDTMPPILNSVRRTSADPALDNRVCWELNMAEDDPFNDPTRRTWDAWKVVVTDLEDSPIANFPMTPSQSPWTTSKQSKSTICATPVGFSLAAVQAKITLQFNEETPFFDIAGNGALNFIPLLGDETELTYRLDNMIGEDPVIMAIRGQGSGNGKVDGFIGSSSSVDFSCITTAGVETGGCNPSIDPVTSTTLFATPSPGSYFAGWNGCHQPVGTECRMFPAVDPQVTAAFVSTDPGENLLLSVGVSGQGAGSVNIHSPTELTGDISCALANGAISGDCEAFLAQGTSLVLRAQVETGSQFLGWAGCTLVTPSNHCQVSMNEPVFVTALFSSVYALSIGAEGAGAGNVTATDADDSPLAIDCDVNAGVTSGDCSENLLDGEVVTLTAESGGGSTFVGFSGCDLNLMNTCTVNMNAVRTVTVNFNLMPTANDDGGVSGDAFTTSEDNAFTTGDVLANDTDSEDSFSISGIETTGTIGQVSSNDNGTFNYNPNGQFEGLGSGDQANDSFDYEITDGHGATASASVTVTITGVNDAPIMQSVTAATQTADYSDTIGEVLVNASDVDSSALTLSVTGGPADLSAGTASCLAAGDGTNCQWTIGGQLLSPGANTHVIDFTAYDSEMSSTCSGIAGTCRHTLDVQGEDAAILMDSGNPVAIEVPEKGGDSGEFTLYFTAWESNDVVSSSTAAPDYAHEGNPDFGDFNKAEGFITLSPLSAAAPITTQCTMISPLPAYPSEGYAQIGLFECTFDAIPINNYRILAEVTGLTDQTLFYTGSVDDSMIVFDPANGSLTGGGWFYWPGTAIEDSEAPCYPYAGDKTMVGFSAKYNRKRSQLKGDFQLQRHNIDPVSCNESEYLVISQSLDTLILGDGEDADGEFGWAQLTGQAIFTAPLAEPVGNHSFILYVEDYASKGCGQVPADKVWVQVEDKNGLVELLLNGYQPVDDHEAIECGDIVVDFKKNEGRGKKPPKK